MSLLESVDRFVGSLGDYPDVLAPLVESVRALALLLDEDSSDSAVWREFRFMFRDLREAAGGSDLAQDLEKEFAALDG